MVHLQENGFKATLRDTTLEAYNRSLGVPAELNSCHTAMIGGYKIVGHIPADAIKRLLREKPAGIEGIAVPGMPLGSPGMDVPGRAAVPYNVMSWDKQGRTSVYEKR